MSRTENCYYMEYGTCTNPGSEYRNKKCPGAACSRFISESDYFLRSMSDGKEPEETEEEKKIHKERIKSNLSLGKTKKQLKYEAKREYEKEHPNGEGFTLADNPELKEFFKNFKE